MGTVALQAEFVSVPVVLIVALALTQHSAALPLRSMPAVAGRNGMAAVSASGKTPVKLLVASEMLVAMRSCPRAQGTIPPSALLLSCSVPKPASLEVLALNAVKLISWHVTPTQERPTPGVVVLCGWYVVAGVLPPVDHGGHGCQCVLPQLLPSDAFVGSTAACTSRSTSIIGRSIPTDVPYNTPLPYVGAVPNRAPLARMYAAE